MNHERAQYSAHEGASRDWRGFLATSVVLAVIKS